MATSPLGRSDALLAATTRAQSLASDPQASAWVSANAGAGKTHVLKLRVLRILLAGTPPDRILCLTYTKAAAAEMASRVFEELASWATAQSSALAPALAAVLSRPGMWTCCGRRSRTPWRGGAARSHRAAPRPRTGRR